MKNFKMMAIIGLVFSSFVPILKNDFPDLEKDESLNVFISRSDKTLFNKTISYPTNRYNKFVDFEVKSFDLIEEEAKQKNMALKVYENKTSPYFVVVMFDKNNTENVTQKTDEKEVTLNKNDFEKIYKEVTENNAEKVTEKEVNNVNETIETSVENEHKNFIDSFKNYPDFSMNKTA